MNPYILKGVIDAEPANVSRTDQEVLDWFKEAVTVWSDITWEQYALWAARYDGIVKMETAKGDADLDIRRAASIGLLVLTAGKDLLLSIIEIRTLMGNLVPDVFSVAEKDDLLAFSQSTPIRWTSHGFPVIDDASALSHISEARAL